MRDFQLQSLPFFKIQRSQHCLKMNIDRILNVGRIATGHGDRCRQAGFQATSKHQTVTLRQAFLGQIKAAETVVLVWVCTGQINR